ncbi:MAG TPA: hypothetical protein VH539_05050 [Gemmatimonadaceae bacterium]
MTPSAVVSGNAPFRIEWLFLLIWLIGGAGILRFHRAVPTTRWQLVVWRESPEVGELGA